MSGVQPRSGLISSAHLSSVKPGLLASAEEPFAMELEPLLEDGLESSDKIELLKGEDVRLGHFSSLKDFETSNALTGQRDFK